MKFDSIIQALIPKDKKFFTMFEKATSNLVTISKVLNEMAIASAPDRRMELAKEIDDLEHIGDQISHDIFSELAATFITPFDREDIHSLTSAIDDIVDHIHGASKRIILYKFEKISPAMQKLAELILHGSEELHKAVCELRNMRNVNSMREACVRINSIENHADDIFDMAVAQLFEDEKNAVEIIKTKEVLQTLETATDKCEDAANVIESIMIKYA
jgi:uncharacterized protein